MCLQFYDTQKSSSRQLGAQCLYVCYMLIHAACATHEVAGAGAIVLCLHGHDHLWDQIIAILGLLKVLLEQDFYSKHCVYCYFSG